MAHLLPGRVLETTTTEDTGTYALAGPLDDTYRAFGDVMSNGDTCFYFIFGGSDYEFGLGTYSGNTLARTEVQGSSNSDAAVDWPAGTKTIGVGPLGPSDMSSSQKLLFAGAAGLVPDTTIQGGSITIADDAVGEITPDYTGGIIILTGNNLTSPTPTPNIGAAYFDVGSSLLASSFIAFSGFAVANSTLAGTTGSDGSITIGRNTGVIQIENRYGQSRTLSYVILKGD